MLTALAFDFLFDLKTLLGKIDQMQILLRAFYFLLYSIKNIIQTQPFFPSFI